jgi:hypothetical protein
LTHFAEFEYRSNSQILPLPAGHQWVCNASIPSWIDVVLMWSKLNLRSAYLCKACIREYGLREPPMRNALEEINRAGTFSNSLQDLVYNKGAFTITRSGGLEPLVLAYWSLGFDLHKGILTVMRDKFYSGGFALLRPLVEAQLRAHLVVRNAKDDVARIKTDDYRMNFDTIGAEIDTYFGLEGYMQSFLERAASVLHSFTHSGLAQIARHYDGDGIGAQYDDEEIIEVVHVATTAIFLLNSLVTKYLGHEDEWKRNGELLAEWIKPH